MGLFNDLLLQLLLSAALDTGSSALALGSDLPDSPTV